MSATTLCRTLSAGLMAAALAITGSLVPAASLASNGPGGDGGGGTADAGSSLSASAIATDRVIVRWADGGGSLAIAESLRTGALSRALGSRVEFVRSGAHGTSIYRLASRLGSRGTKTLAAMRKVQGVASVQPDRIMKHSDTPDDPYAELLWALLSPADGGSVYGLDPTSVWPVTTGTGAVVAVVDTGITDHLDLAGQVLPGYDMISDPSVAGDGDERDPNPADEGDWDAYQPSSWHGTHVAGTIAALAGNGVGVFGAAPGAKIVPVRVLGHDGGYESDVMDGIAWAGGAEIPDVPANANPARVINVSLGGGGGCDPYSQAAIDDARAGGALVVAAAGNAGSDAESFTPANCEGVLAVAATDSSGRRASFSNFGTTVGIAAPGVDILSTMNAGRTVPATNPSGSVYSTYSGTSMATPHVTAAAALVAAAFPDLSGDDIRSLLRASATPFPAPAAVETQPCSMVGCGSGIVNVAAAFERLQSGPPLIGSVKVPAWSTGGSDVTVHATAVSGVGIASATAAIDGGAPTPMTASDGSFGGQGERVELTFTASSVEGPHQVCVTATSTSSLQATPVCEAFSVDSTVPTGTATRVSGTSVVAGQPVEMSRTFTDEASGIGAVTLTWDGVPIAAGTGDGTLGDLQETALGIAGGAATSITAGIGQSCVLTPGGAVACWGTNDSGQVGDGSAVNRAVPRLVKVGGPAISVAGSAYHGCAVRSDHHLVCWGTDSGGQFGTTSISGAPPMEIPGITDAVSVVAGLLHTCILTEAGTVTCLGTFMSTSDFDAPPFSADTSSLTDVVAITSGYFAACALEADGTVWCWGTGPLGELGNGKILDSPVPVAVSGLHDAVAISAGDEFACAIRSDGSVWCWGVNVDGELGRVPTAAELRGDLPPFSAVPSPVPGPTRATDVSTGYSHACATGPDGTWCWGGNTYGQVGTGEESAAEAPAQLAVGPVVDVAAGLLTTCVNGTGGVRCWGAGEGGMLGNGNLYANEPAADELTPQAVVGFSGAATVGDHALCLKAADLAGNETAPTCTTVTVAATTPSAPTVVTAQAGDGRVEVDWQPPVTDGGSPITGYEVTAPFGATGCTVDASARSCMVEGLTNGLVHDFTVVAETGIGQSDAAAVAAIPATGMVTRVKLGTGRLDLSHGRAPVLVALSTSVPTITPGLAYRFADRSASGVVAGQATTGVWGLVPAPIGTPVTYEGWATVGGAATPVFSGLPKTILATQDTSAAVRFHGTWNKRVTKSAFGGSQRSTSVRGRTVSFRVTGSSVAWVGSVGPDRGRASVYVDGHRRATLDLYARTGALARVLWASDLGPGSHTVKIVVLGTHNAHSRGSRVDLDAFLRMD